MDNFHDEANDDSDPHDYDEESDFDDPELISGRRVSGR